MSAHSVELTINQNSISAPIAEMDCPDTLAENSASQTCENSTSQSLPIGMTLSTFVLTCLIHLARFVKSAFLPWVYHAILLFVSASIAALSVFMSLLFLFVVYTGSDLPTFSDVSLTLFLLIVSKIFEIQATDSYPLQSSDCDDCYYIRHQGELI